MTKQKKYITKIMAPKADSEFDSKQHSILLVCAVFACIVAVIALVLSIVALSGPGAADISIISPASNSGQQTQGNTGNEFEDNKTWLLAFEETGVNYGYIDDSSGELRGFSIDMANAVCQIAGKNCQTVFDSGKRCWDSVSGSRAQGGKGLFHGYYDACVGRVHSYEIPRTFRFSDPYTDNLPPAVLLTLQGNPGDFNWMDLRAPKIGFIDSFVFDEHCLARSDFVSENALSASQIIHYPSRPAAQQGLRDNEVDAIFDAKRLYLRNPEFQIVSDDFLTCFKAGFSVMTRKDNPLIDWWNPAFAKLVASSQWNYICNDLLDEHGHIGGGTPSNCVGID